MVTRSVIKSAGRAFEVLEFFSATRRPASLADIVRALDLPPSSASVLLHSLVTLGYVEYLAESRRFRPTLRVTLLGDWIGQSLFDEPLTQRLLALQRRTGETVLLGRRQGAELQYFYAVQPEDVVQLLVRAGLQRPMTRTAMGRVLLSKMPEAAARSVIRRNNADAKQAEHRVDENKLIKQLELVRHQGFAESDSYAATPEAYVFASPLPVEGDAESLAVGVGGPAARVLRRREKIVDLLKVWLTEG